MPQSCPEWPSHSSETVRDYLGPGYRHGSNLGVPATRSESLSRELTVQAAGWSEFAKLVGSAGPGPSTDELMALLRGD